MDIDIRNRCWQIHGTGHVEQARLEQFERDLLAGIALAAADVPCWPDFRGEA